ncbi:MAG: PEP-CTERM sorting domain-containing protein [Acidobacteria bacterium]|nr:PEP-CTERM sorting domain-containing protein [Acidobacteriota bacterium]
MLTRRIPVLLFGAVLLSQVAWCAPLLYARQLPTAGVNAADAERSNWTWYDYSDLPPLSRYATRWLQGDGFSLPFSSSGQWVIDTIVTYSVASVGTYSAAAFGAEFSSVALYTGVGDPSYAGMFLRAAGAINPDGTNANPNITHERIFYYNDNQLENNYLDALANWAPLWKTTFASLNWVVGSGVEYYFAVDGAPRALSGTYGLWYNHFTNYLNADAGDQADGADYQYWIFYNSELPLADGSRYLQNDLDYVPFLVDMNVEIYGNEAEVIPEPGSVFLVALGGIFLIACRAKRRLV